MLKFKLGCYRDEGRNQSRGFPERLHVGLGSGAPRTLRSGRTLEVVDDRRL